MFTHSYPLLENFRRHRVEDGLWGLGKSDHVDHSKVRNAVLSIFSAGWVKSFYSHVFLVTIEVISQLEKRLLYLLMDYIDKKQDYFKDHCEDSKDLW